MRRVYLLGGAARNDARRRTVAAEGRRRGGADALFDQGKSEMKAGRYAAACAAFGESYALDAADGTLLALALCHEQQGELVKAFGELQAVHASSLRSGREDRQRVARAALSRVEPRIARVAIRVPSRDRACASTLRIDGAQVHVTEEASPDRGLVVGRHRISCECQPGDSWSTMVDVGAGELAVVVVPEKSEPGASAGARGPCPAARRAGVVRGLGAGLGRRRCGRGFTRGGHGLRAPRREPVERRGREV